MKKNNKQSNNIKNCLNKDTKSCKNCKHDNVKNSDENNIGFENNSKSFTLDENDDHSFELK